MSQEEDTEKEEIYLQDSGNYEWIVYGQNARAHMCTWCMYHRGFEFVEVRSLSVQGAARRVALQSADDQFDFQ